jgi:DNA-directed RNA polymerase subunit L
MVVFNHPAFQNVDFKMQVFSKLVSTKALEKMINRLDDSLISLGQNAHSKLILFQLGVEMMRSFKTKE